MYSITRIYAGRRPSTEKYSDLGLGEVFTLCDKGIFPVVHNECVTVVAYRPALESIES